MTRAQTVAYRIRWWLLVLGVLFTLAGVWLLSGAWPFELGEVGAGVAFTGAALRELLVVLSACFKRKMRFWSCWMRATVRGVVDGATVTTGLRTETLEALTLVVPAGAAVVASELVATPPPISLGGQLPWPLYIRCLCTCSWVGLKVVPPLPSELLLVELAVPFSALSGASHGG